MTLTDAQRDRYADIVLGYLDGDYTMDPDDAKHVAEEVIAAYQEDQAARRAAMEHDMRVLVHFAQRQGPTGHMAVDEAIERLAAALEATEQEAGK